MVIRTLPRMRRRRASLHRVVAVTYDRVALFELAIAAEVFGLPRPELGAPLYAFDICSMDRGPLRSTGAVQLGSGRGLGILERADTIIVPGWRDPREEPPARLL